MASPSERGSQSRRSWADEVEEAEEFDSLHGRFIGVSSHNPFAAPFSRSELWGQVCKTGIPHRLGYFSGL